MDAFLVINCSLDALLMLISITANALILSALFRTPSLRSPSTIFLCSLAVSDLLVGLVVQPVYIANELTSSNSLLHRSANILLGIACSVSLFTMTAISVDRFLALRYHMRYPILMTEKRAICTTDTIWFICIVAPSLSLSHNRHGVFALGIAICIFISTFSYIRIYQIVRQHQLQIQAQQQAVQTDHNLNHARSTKTAINTFIFYACMILSKHPKISVNFECGLQDSVTTWTPVNYFRSAFKLSLKLEKSFYKKNRNLCQFLVQSKRYSAFESHRALINAVNCPVCHLGF